jgi:sn-glycerol 3-phosphate transport system ATP-binding protein
MNFLPATLAAGGTAAQLDAGPLVVFTEGRRPGPDGYALTVGIRPEHLVPASEGLPLQIELIEPLGSETLVHGRLQDEAGTPLVVKVIGHAPVGESLTVAPQPAQLHVFDRETGRRIEPIGADGALHTLVAAGSPV